MKALRISIADQALEVVDDGVVTHRYPVSTASNGAGERNGSYCTPRGRHVIRAKIGADQPPGAFFFNEPATTEIYTLPLRGDLPIL